MCLVVKGPIVVHEKLDVTVWNYKTIQPMQAHLSDELENSTDTAGHVSLPSA